MTFLLTGLVLTALIVAARGYRGHSAELGSMSAEWVAALRLARPSSSV